MTDQSAANVKQLDIRKTFAKIIGWVKADTPFYHVRICDGEYRAMFHLCSEQDTTSREHHYLTGMCDAMADTVNKICEAILHNPSHILFGSVVGTDFPPDAEEASARRFLNYVAAKPSLLGKAQWSSADCWYTTMDEANNNVDDKGVLALINSLRTCGRPVVIIGNKSIADARYCLGADFIEVRVPDAWLDINHVLAECAGYAPRRATFVWCAGFLSKPASWSLKSLHPDSSHIDLGHFFDPVFGVMNRAWTRRFVAGNPSNLHYEYLSRVITPYIKSFVPK